MFSAILLQGFATLLAVIVAAVFVGERGAVSAAIGGLASTIPNLLFALRLRSVSGRPGASFPLNFFLGEFLKVALTVVLLVCAVMFYADLHWLTMLIGLGLALQAGLLMAFRKKS